MNPIQFVNKWRQTQLSERAAAQEHFLDLCALVGHPSPAEFDPTGEKFTFERGAAKHGGGDGWADVWKRGCFGWEYKGKHKDLDAAYDQLLLYREALENPPLLVVCDMERIIVHTNFTAVVNQVLEIPLDAIGEPRSLEIIRAVFFEPEKLKPGRTSEAVTQKAAQVFAGLAGSLRARGVAPDVAAHFLDRIVFALFAEDIGLLPGHLFSSLIENAVARPALFHDMAGQLFRAMAQGGVCGVQPIRHFNGSLFEDATALELTADELKQIQSVADLDWSAVDVSIFGTLFERGMDPAKRAQLGAHYTSRQDIELLVEPVIMAPLRAEWASVRDAVTKRLAAAENSKSKTKNSVLRSAKNDGYSVVGTFLQRLAHVKVLDPACGSGNFLYVTLQKLKDLEKEIILFAMANGLGAFLPTVGPWQLYGIEINSYAYDLALMTVWLGYLQWVKANGFGFPNDPILHKLEGNFRCMDAILDLTDPANPREPEWPRVDFIVSNPPFLGGNRVRQELGDNYVEALFKHYDGRVPAFSDLCCYWFEKARQHVVEGKCRRAGLLATQGIRGGVNREVLKRIKQSGGIFWAESDREWILDGANVRVSMVAFDDGSQKSYWLDGSIVGTINPDLTSAADLTRAKRLPDNNHLCFIDTKKAGAFELGDADGLALLREPSPNGRPNSDVIRPWVNGDCIARSRHFLWIVDAGVGMPLEAMAQYEGPFRHVLLMVKPERDTNKEQRTRERFWIHKRPGPDLRVVLTGQNRCPAVVRHSKHFVISWIETIVLPDDGIYVFARSDDYFLGVLQSHINAVWALAQGTALEDRPRYTPTTCFETFPFPWAPGKEPTDDPRVQAIAGAAKALCELRDRWLNPPEWTKDEVLEFPGTVGGPWTRHIANADMLKPGDVATVQYHRLVPRDAACAAQLAGRTLTNLYNQRPEWLAMAHRRLDEAVAAAYGWPADMSDSTILEKLLALNLERAGAAPV